LGVLSCFFLGGGGGGDSESVESMGTGHRTLYMPCLIVSLRESTTS
jgi:hypothetical protein